MDFLVMEFLDGETLERRLEKGPLPPEQTIRYGAQIANALAKAHKLGITHRDLKPANVKVLYEMATGKPAFSGTSRASLIAAILTTEPPSITQLQPLTPVTLERVVKKCLAKDPDDRWQSAADLASELQWMCTGSPTSQSAMDAGSRL